MTVDKALVAARFGKAADTYDAEAEVQHRAARRLVDLVLAHRSGPVRDVLEIGCGTGYLSRRLHKSLRPDRLRLNDICPSMRGQLHDLIKCGVDFAPGDAETCRLGSGYDLVASASAVQWFAEPMSFVSRCLRILKPGGCLAFSSYGPENVKQITQLTGMGLRYPSLREWVSMFGEEWRLAAAEEETIDRAFASPREVLRHLRRTGVTGAGKFRWTPRALRSFEREYLRRHSKDGMVTLTYHPLHIVATRRDTAGEITPPAASAPNATILC